MHGSLLFCVDRYKRKGVQAALSTWLNEAPRVMKGGQQCVVVEVKHYPSKTALRQGLRMYSRGKLVDRGVQGLPSEVRNFLFSEFCGDFDLVNCYPSAALGIFEKFFPGEVLCPKLRRYVVSRDEVTNN